MAAQGGINGGMAARAAGSPRSASVFVKNGVEIRT
jgi:hypothetical protein